MIDNTHWEKLASLEPSQVCSRALCGYDASTASYLLDVTGQGVRVSPALRAVEFRDGKACGFAVTLVSVVHLVSAQDLPAAGRWVSPERLRYGDFFFRGPHRIDAGEIVRRFGSDPAGFLAAGRHLGGRALEFGDASICLDALPRVPVCVVLWGGDEEFPARANFLVDENALEQLPLDALWMLLLWVSSRICSAQQPA